MNGHRQLDWGASPNIGRQGGRAGIYRMCIRANATPGFLLHRSRGSLRWSQCFSLREESNTRSTCRFRALITPMRANIVGPPRSATSMSASIATCHSGNAASFFGRPVTCVAASRSVRSFSPSGRAIGSSNSRGHPSQWDASQLLRWRQRSSLTHAATPTASCFIDRARVCPGPMLFLP